VPANISTTKVELRNASGSAKVALTPATGIVDVIGTTVNIVSANEVNVQGAAINLNGPVNITGALTINGAAYTAHKHSGVQTGGGQTGGVV
jgi:phage baseplate assembly protein gpV